MKNKFALFTLLGIFLLGTYTVFAQDNQDTIITEEVIAEEVIAEAEETQAPVEESASFHQIIKQKFIEGGPGFMGIVLLCLILGLALAIERIIYLNMATTDTDKLLNDVEGALQSGGVESAKEVCRNTKGPVASIFYQGLDRSGEGIDMVEKSIVSYGSVQMGLLEKGLSWISLFIALAPMLGFMGTVIGMIGAFDAIEAAGDISPSLVAGGIKVALLTTVFGLIVVRSAPLIPPATSEGEISPAASIASNAPIIPITVPINPSIGAKAINNEIHDSPFSNNPI
jgi:biopolymer transport protein ExbB